MGELPLKQRLLILSETIRMTEKAFIHWGNATIGSEELENLSEEFFEKAVVAERREDFQMVMWEYFGKLRNVHSNYFDRLAPFPYGGMFNLFVHELEDEWVVKEDASGLLMVGDIVKSLGGRPFQEWLSELSHLTCITEWRSMRVFVYHSIFLTLLRKSRSKLRRLINMDSFGLSNSCEPLLT